MFKTSSINVNNNNNSNNNNKTNVTDLVKVGDLVQGYLLLLLDGVPHGALHPLVQEVEGCRVLSAHKNNTQQQDSASCQSHLTRVTSRMSRVDIYISTR